MSEHYGWPQAQSLRTAASWLPEVFGGINRSSIYRWKLKKKPHSGRPHKLSETQFLSAPVFFHDLVKKRVP